MTKDQYEDYGLGRAGLAQWAPQPAMNLAELAELVKSMPRIPKREMHAGPGALEYMRNRIAPPENSYTWYDEMSRLLMSAPIYENYVFARGQLIFYTDGEITASWNCEEE